MTLLNSTYLDATGSDLTTDTTVKDAFGLTDVGQAGPDARITMALVLDRANDPTNLLNMNWADREAALGALNANGTLASTFGANPADFFALRNELNALGIHEFGAGDGFVSSAASRTAWVSLDPAQFEALFGTRLLVGTLPSGGKMLFWNGDLSPSVSTPITGLWLQDGRAPTPDATGTSYPLQNGPQSPGNSSTTKTLLYPNAIAGLYQFPLLGTAIRTGTIGLIETGVGAAVNPWDNAQTLLDAYRQAAGAAGSGTISEGPVEWAPSVSSGNAGERSLDVGVVGAASPNSDMILYAGAGSNYSAFQEAIWGAADAPAVLSSSFAESVRATPGSPFYNAYQQLFVDAALRNISVFFAGGDTGSSATKPAGVPLINFAHSTPYATIVGGTSFSTLDSAESDETLNRLVGLALDGDPATLRSLVAGGLTQMPSDGNVLTRFVETVWNQYRYDAATQTIYSYTKNLAGSGGVDTTLPEPGYQQAFGIDTASLGYGQAGRGDPDVSGLAGGNMLYITPHKDLTFDPADHGGTLGTSATSPLWAALTAQIQAVFADVGLPGTGYFNDLLYTAAAVSPGAFNDITIGNNISTYVLGGNVTDAASGEKITPTGMGFRAAPGYDLTSGLGTPNGVLLTRSLLAIAEAEMYSGAAPMTDSTGQVSGATQILTVQPMLATGFNGLVGVQTSQGSMTAQIAAGSALAWTSQLAQQVLQPGFDSNLVRLFDGDAQAAPFQVSVHAASDIGVSIGGTSVAPTGQELTTSYGFANYAGDNGNSVELARPVAVAQTAGGADDQDAIVRIRQDGVDQLRLTFYRVDDYQGTVKGIAPGQPDYEQAALQRAYSTVDGSSSISAPGYGNYAETSLTHVNAGDLIAMELTNVTTQDMFWGFAGMNEIAGGAHVSHLWSYGLNTWGWEDTYGGGDQDYNDAVVQMDFTSGAGHQLVA